MMAWIDERLAISPMITGFLDRRIPAGVGWFHTLGSAALTLLLVQIATGIALTLSYVPSPDHAYESVLYIDATPFGGLVRAVHHWSAGALVLIVGLHALRVFVWASYKYPREINWIVGAFLLFVVLGFAFTGYLLPWDQKAYWATVVGTNIAGAAPLVGGAALELLRGGTQLGAVSLTRFYGLHIWLLPAALLTLAGIHLFGVIRQGIAAPPRRVRQAGPDPGETRREAYERDYAEARRHGRPFWDALARDAVVSLLVVAGVMVLAAVLGAPLEPKADANTTAYAPRPEWYFLDMFQLLWYFTGGLEPLLIFGVVTLAAAIFLLVPFIDRRRERHPRRRPLAMSLAGLTVVIVLGLTGLGAVSGAAAHATVPARPGMTVQDLSGLRIYNAQGCSACHSIGGVGGDAGPDLSRAGFRWDVAAIQAQIVTPKDPRMPAFDHLSQQELEDLVHFLADQK